MTSPVQQIGLRVCRAEIDDVGHAVFAVVAVVVVVVTAHERRGVVVVREAV